jgi:hypothetical protein
MRRTLAAVAVALTLVATGAATRPSYAEDDLEIRSPETAPVEQAASAPADVLRQAEAALEGDVAGTRRPDATVALRELFASLPRLSGSDRAEARGILARPTNRSGPTGEIKYRTRSVKRCGRHVCVHHVERTRHAASTSWTRKTLRVMEGVWRHQIGAMGYRRPVDDGRRGGNGKLDVYLANVGSRGLYGYCVPELTKPGYRRIASGYCVLDNNFARSQFGGEPIDSLRVTAAHEFFHAVQFAYDYLEDPWMMEATATWIEERYADRVNDNRQYLPAGQLVRTHVPLDTFKSGSAVQYGNWVFFEYLSMRFGAEIVKQIWRQSGHFKGDGTTYSTDAINRVLPRRAPFRKVFSQFSAANIMPGRSYPEGRFWPSPRMVSQGSLGRGEGTSGTLTIDHMSTQNIQVTPKEGLDEQRFKLRVRIDGPLGETSPMAALVWQQSSGDVKTLPIPLNPEGIGSKVVPFNRRQTQRVWLVLSSASTRFDNCGGKNHTYSCSGTPRDDDLPFAVDLRVISRR